MTVSATASDTTSQVATYKFQASTSSNFSSIAKESTAQLAQADMIGKYVNYVPAGSNYTVDGTYSGTGSNQTFYANNSMKWRIWGVEGNKLLLISETLAGKITLKGANGYNNGVKLLNDARSTAFGNGST